MLEIRHGGLVLLHGEEVGRIELDRPYLEPEIIGVWYLEGSEELAEWPWGDEP
jgi:hypothetical protein